MRRVFCNDRRLIKPRRFACVTNDTYFEYNNGLILNKDVLFEDLGDVNGFGFDFAFPNMRVAVFKNVDHNYTWYNMEPAKMPNLRHICLATRYDDSIIYRFPKYMNVWYHISDKHLNPHCVPRSNLFIWNHDALINFIERLPTQKLQVLTTDRMRKHD